MAGALVSKPSSKEQKLSVVQLVKERLKWQPDVLIAHPTMPEIKQSDIVTF
jgi:hypothetical protein